MKTLLVMRHAKSSWDQGDLKDFERPLNKRGERDAPRMGRLLLDQELVPQLILSSPAARTRATVDAVTAKIGFTGEVRYFDSFYLGEASAYIEILRTLPDDLERVMVVGHNPGLESLVQILSEEIESLPTAAIAYLVLPIQAWSELNSDVKGDLIQLWQPRDLPE